MNGHVEYDTAEIRRSARQVGSAANELDSVASELRRLAAEVPDALQGDAGTVLEDLLSKRQCERQRLLICESINILQIHKRGSAA